jgi:hypothetical protein
MGPAAQRHITRFHQWGLGLGGLVRGGGGTDKQLKSTHSWESQEHMPTLAPLAVNAGGQQNPLNQSTTCDLCWGLRSLVSRTCDCGAGHSCWRRVRCWHHPFAVRSRGRRPLCHHGLRTLQRGAGRVLWPAKASHNLCWALVRRGRLRLLIRLGLRGQLGSGGHRLHGGLSTVFLFLAVVILEPGAVRSTIDVAACALHSRKGSMP